MNKKIFIAFVTTLTIAFLLFNFASAKAQNEKGLNNAHQAREKIQAQNNAKINRGQAETHRSEVAEFVLNLLKVAEKEPGGIGEQIRNIAREQNEATEKIAPSLEKIEKRNKIKTFFIGTDYKNLGQLRSEMVRVRNRIERLKRLQERIENEQERNEIQSQIQAMERERARIEDFIKANEEKFSLFGWFLKLFNKNK